VWYSQVRPSVTRHVVRVVSKDFEWCDEGAEGWMLDVEEVEEVAGLVAGKRGMEGGERHSCWGF
jgi:hypothetical protein